MNDEEGLQERKEGAKKGSEKEVTKGRMDAAR